MLTSAPESVHEGEPNCADLFESVLGQVHELLEAFNGRIEVTLRNELECQAEGESHLRGGGGVWWWWFEDEVGYFVD